MRINSLIGVVIFVLCATGQAMAGPPDAALTLLSGTLAQFPDKKVLQALQLLEPGEVPPGPARVGKLKELPEYENYPADVLWRAQREVGGFVNPNLEPLAPDVPATTYVNRDHPHYKKGGPRLAALLAHEGRHVGGADEVEALTAQLEVIRRIAPDDEDMIAMIENAIARRKLGKGG
jgi:hypothetical protein